MGHFFRLVIMALFFIVIIGVVTSSAVTQQEYVNNLVNKAMHYSRQEGKETLAVSLINKAIKIQPRNLKLYYKRASVKGHIKNYAGALSDLNIVMRNDTGRKKKFPSAVKYRAECFSALGYMKNAIDDYKIATSSLHSAKIWLYYAELLWYLGQKSEALDAINKGLSLNQHWTPKLRKLQNKIFSGEKVKLHTPFTN